MATGIVITVAEKLFGVLRSEELKQVCSMLGYESQLDELACTVEMIKAVLLDAGSMHQELSYEGREYIERLKDAVYDVDDVMDDFNTMVRKMNKKQGGKRPKKVHRFFSRSNQLLVAFNMSQEIKKLRKKLDNIAKDRQQFGFGNVHIPVKKREETGSYVSEKSIIGREADKRVILGLLAGEFHSDDVHNNVSFVSIVGIGGMGKTALAQLVYSDDVIDKTFDLKLWICVSNEFSMDQILAKILGRDAGRVDEMQTDVRKLIEGKKYLLVLDDVWSESRDEWVKLRSFFDLGYKGSRLMVTTRSKKVARAIGSDPMYELPGLSDESSWNLFKRIAFKGGNQPVDSEVTDIGKDIVKKCANVPLSIRVIASMLYDQDISKWESFRSVHLKKMRQGQNGQNEDGIMPILKFSYYHLSVPLKTCFSYCSLFAKDEFIEKEDLINLWLAQGCLEGQSPEDLGKEYFLTLLQRCFFQDAEEDEYGDISFCKMHDLIHDLAQEVAGKESRILDSSGSHFDKKTRHIVVDSTCHLLRTPSNELGEMNNLRTFSQKFPSLVTDSNLMSTLPTFRRLRVLKLMRLGMKMLPTSVVHLSHLRQLDLSWNEKLEALPRSITKLYNLQMLNLKCCSRLRELPKGLSELVNLRHLNINHCRALTHMPAKMDRLTCLHTLTTFIVGRESSEKVQTGRLCDLEPLSNLSGCLSVYVRSDSTSDAIYGVKGAFLKDKVRLQALEIEREGYYETISLVESCSQGHSDEATFECFEPHKLLERIDIRGYKGIKLPIWTENLATSLPCLVTIALWSCHGLQHLPSLSQLRHLKYLVLAKMHSLEYIEADDDENGVSNLKSTTSEELVFFPSLESLELMFMPNLKGWRRQHLGTKQDSGCRKQSLILLFPRLCALEIEDCPRMTSFPGCPHAKNLTLSQFNQALTFPCGRGLSYPTSTSTSPSNVLCPGVSYITSCSNDEDSTDDHVLSLDRIEIDDVSFLDSDFGKSVQSIHELIINLFSQKSLSTVAEGYRRHSSSLRSLEIRNCNSLQGLKGADIQYLTSLRNLRIRDCNEFELEEEEVEPWKSLHNLASLKLLCLPKLVNLPKGLQYLTGLQTLKIVDCQMEVLPEWFHCLTSLRRLDIRKCSQLKALPEALRYLPSLREVIICNCKGLTTRCREPDGEDWPIIGHIPRLIVE